MFPSSVGLAEYWFFEYNEVEGNASSIPCINLEQLYDCKKNVYQQEVEINQFNSF